MARWAAFVGLSALLLVAVLVLARRSTALFREAKRDRSPGRPATAVRTGDLTTGVMLANVAATQALLIALLSAGVYLFDVPLAALGLGPGHVVWDADALTAGLGLGLALWLCSETAGRIANAAGLTYDETLRRRLAPETRGGWLLLFLGVLPLVAVGEELLFRAAVIGVPAAGFGVSPWLLAIVSGVAFGLGHGAQGRVGVAATAALGFVLAAAMVATGSLVVVVVAHYVVNALEFGVHEATA